MARAEAPFAHHFAEVSPQKFSNCVYPVGAGLAFSPVNLCAVAGQCVKLKCLR